MTSVTTRFRVLLVEDTGSVRRAMARALRASGPFGLGELVARVTELARHRVPSQDPPRDPQHGGGPGPARGAGEDVEKALQALRDLRVDGVELNVVAGQDIGLRPGNASCSITVDLADEQAYRGYDLDAEHNRIRAEMFVPISASAERVQFRLPDRPRPR